MNGIQVEKITLTREKKRQEGHRGRSIEKNETRREGDQLAKISNAERERKQAMISFLSFE
jgi:hypothetical protein